MYSVDNLADNSPIMQMEHTLFIEKIIHGGLGLGRLPNGKALMIPLTLPGEKVRAQVSKENKSYAQGRVVEVLSASPHRITPPCTLYAKCGGCNLQHTDISYQRQIKREVVEEALQRAGLGEALRTMEAPLPSPQNLAYRYRLRLHLNRSGELGFHGRKSNTVVPLTECLLATEGINALIQGLNQAEKKVGLLTALARYCKQIECIESPLDQHLFVVCHSGSQTHPIPQTLQETVRQALALPSLRGYGGSGDCGAEQNPTVTFAAPRSSQQDVPGPKTTNPSLAQNFTLRGDPSSQNSTIEYTLRWDSQCFFQVNARQNQRLVDLVQECLIRPERGQPSLPLLPLEEKTLLELYCGMGNFSLPALLQGAHVHGIEHNAHAIGWAVYNAKNNIPDTQDIHQDVHQGVTTALKKSYFLASDVAKRLRCLVNQGKRYDYLLLDPPRQGVGKEAALLGAFHAQRIVYISCDPATLARDLVHICASGYRITRIIPVDMFPQTHHIESVVSLEKN